MSKKTRIFKKHWDFLKLKEKETRVRALETLRQMRVGQSLTSASKLIGISPKTARLQLGAYIFKRKRRWHAKAKDTIERGLVIYERGRVTHIVTNNSESASLVGQYFNDVKKALTANDERPLKKYKKVAIKDSAGKKHKLETRLEKVKYIELGRENLEFPDVYDYPY